jgi:large-conductance mechanosensitive channel
MAGQSRTLKLALLADVANFTKDIGTAGKSTQTLGDQASEFGKKAALAFAAAGAAIGAFAIASVKAAAEDEAGQKKLEETIRNTTNATAEQIAGIDKYITKQSIATATTDDVIRPALSRLLRSTGDLTKAQELLTLSQEIAAATGKPLEAVTNAVAKSFDGSNTALTKLGVGIDAATLKTLTFDETQQLLNKTFDGFIENQSTTAQFKFEQLSIAIGETKEQVGAALLPAVTALTDYILVNVVPVVQSFVDGLTGQDGLKQGLTESQKTAIEWGKRVKGLIETVINFKDELLIVAGVIAGIFVASKIAAGVTATIALIKLITAAYVALRNTALAAAIASRFAVNPFLGLAAAAGIAAAIYGATKVFAGDDAAAQNLSGGTPFADTIRAAGGTFGGGGGGTTGGGTTGGGVVTGGGGGGGGAVAAVVANAATVTKKAEQVVTDIAGAFDDFTSGTTTLAGINAASNRGFPFGTSGVNTNTLAGIMAASAQPTINVTVNGAIDPEGTARTIVDTLNNSYYRGTGGAGNLVAV